MKRKLLGGMLALMGAFITAVAIQHHSYGLASMFAIMTIVVTYHFFGERE